MLIKSPADIKPSEITDERVFAQRRRFLRNGAVLGLAGAGLAGPAASLLAANRLEPNQQIIEAFNSPYSTDEELTPYDKVTTYNNFYEFGTNKSDPAEHSGQFKPQPWTLEVSGECDHPGSYDVEDFISPHKLEERIYRLRCVEAWSMVIPWVGVPVHKVLSRFGPNSHAKYVSFETVLRPKEMPGQLRTVLDWPYREGLRMDEAMHPLSIFVVGLYGKILPNQNGAPIRLMVPWKYGFKSIKSIVRVEFTRTQPRTAWNDSAPQEYGFYSNVNPQVDHPRWSQRKERRIGEFFKRETLMFNGYADQVASLYADMDLLRHF